MRSKSSGLLYGSGLNKTAFSTQKIAVFAPMQEPGSAKLLPHTLCFLSMSALPRAGHGDLDQQCAKRFTEFSGRNLDRDQKLPDPNTDKDRDQHPRCKLFLVCQTQKRYTRDH